MIAVLFDSPPLETHWNYFLLGPSSYKSAFDHTFAQALASPIG